MPDFSPLVDLGRSRFVSELQDPRVYDRLIAYTQAEVGGQGPQARQAFMETIFNRAAARGQTLRQTLSGSYFPDVTHERAARGIGEGTRAEYAPTVGAVLSGSNVANYATGNASGKVGFAGGPQTSAYGGERYGIEGPDVGWARTVGYEGPVGQGVGYTGQGQRTIASEPTGAAPATERGWAAKFAAALPANILGTSAGSPTPSYTAVPAFQPIQLSAPLSQIGLRRFV